MDRDQARQHLEQERERLRQVRDAAVGLGGGAQESPAREQSSADHPAEQASETLERELDTTVVQRVEAELAELEAALERLSGESYGRCEVCGKAIAEARLEVMPAARYCIDDQAKAERNRH